MARYSEEFKYSIMKKMMPPENQSVSSIAIETGLSEGTLPILADRGIYLASESTFYRVLRAHNMQYHRGLSKKPST